MNRLFFLLTIITLVIQEGNGMVFHKNIINLTRENDNFRKVLATASHSQIVLMSLKPGEDIGSEIHEEVDQVLIFVKGNGIAHIAGKEYNVSEGDIFLVPSGTEHNFINTGKQDLKLFTIYAPAEFEKEITQKLKPNGRKI